MKTSNIAALASMAICTLVSLVSCSGADMDLSTREKPIVDNVATSVDDTFVSHNWQTTENSFIDDATSTTKYTQAGSKNEFSINLPASIEWNVNEALRSSKTFTSTAKTVGQEVQDLVDSKSLKDTTVYTHNRIVSESFEETTIKMNTSWENGYVFINNEKSDLAYVKLDSVVSFPTQTTVQLVEQLEEGLERYSFSMPHKAYYTEVSLRGKKNIEKGFNVNGTFLYKEAGNDEPVVTPDPEKNLVDASFINRYFNNDEQKSYMTLNCVWSDGTNSEMTFWVSLPYGWSFPAEWSVNSTNEGPSKFVKLVQDANPNKSQYAETSETNATEYGKVLRRKVSKKTQFTFTDFTEELSSFHHEAYISINGKDFQFLSPEESISQGVNEQSTSKDGKISTEVNTVKANIKFNQASFHTSGIVNVIREENDANNEEPGINLPSTYGNITGVMGVTRICEMSSKTPVWHTCVTVRTDKGQIRIIDENTVSFMSFDEAYDDSRMSSAAYKDGTVYPAMISIDNSGWTYIAETKTGISFAVEMSDQLAINSGIKNFAKNNSAKPSPIVEYTSSTKNGILTVSYKINGTAKVVTVK